MATSDIPAEDGRATSGFGFIRKLFGDLSASRTSTAMADPAVLTERRLQNAIAIAARGDAFDFWVRPNFTWSAKAMTGSRFEQCIETYTPEAIHTLRLRIEPVARRYEPYRARALENELNAMLGVRDWDFGPAAVALTCRPEVVVLPDDRVRESQQPYWIRRGEMQSEHDLAMRRAELIQERTRTWSAIMAELQKDPLARHAAMLAEHSEFAEVFKELTQGRKDELLKLIELLEKAGRSYDGIGLYEYAEGLDAALVAYRKQADVL